MTRVRRGLVRVRLEGVEVVVGSVGFVGGVIEVEGVGDVGRCREGREMGIRG